MLVIPAIDLLDGKVVRLSKGIMEDATEYGHDPRDVALMFAAMGATRIHIVDLNGARTGDGENYAMIKAITAKTDVKIEVGGGIRNMQKLDKYFEMGVAYGILGTAAVKDPEFTRAALKKYPNRIILGIDVKDGCAATEGWYEASGLTALDVINAYADFEVESVIYTDIERDGMLAGINFGGVVSLAGKSKFPVIASGGVSSIGDINDLKELNHKNIKGCIVGKAFYEGKMDLDRAFK